MRGRAKEGIAQGENVSVLPGQAVVTSGNPPLAYRAGRFLCRRLWHAAGSEPIWFRNNSSLFGTASCYQLRLPPTEMCFWTAYLCRETARRKLAAPLKDTEKVDSRSSAQTQSGCSFFMSRFPDRRAGYGLPAHQSEACTGLRIRLRSRTLYRLAANWAGKGVYSLLSNLSPPLVSWQDWSPVAFDSVSRCPHPLRLYFPFSFLGPWLVQSLPQFSQSSRPTSLSKFDITWFSTKSPHFTSFSSSFKPPRTDTHLRDIRPSCCKRFQRHNKREE